MPGKPINTQPKNERKLNFWERMYLPEVFRGLGYTFNKLAKEPIYTVQYPEEQWYPPDIFRGRPVLVEENGRPRCVSCNLCARACPPMAISMQSKEMDDPTNPKEREPAWFEINMLRCILCGYCEEACPEEAIVMSKEYGYAFQSPEEAIFGLDRLLTPGEQRSDRRDFLGKCRNPQIGQHWEYKKDNNRHSLKDRHFIRWLIEEGMTDLENTHLRPSKPRAVNREWGGERTGPFVEQEVVE